MVTLNTEEVDEIKALIAAGKLPPDTLKAHFAAEEKAVFGHDVRHDRKKRPIEQGIGSPGNESENHFAAMLARENAGLEEKGTTKKLRDEWLARKADQDD